MWKVEARRVLLMKQEREAGRGFLTGPTHPMQEPQALLVTALDQFPVGGIARMSVSTAWLLLAALAGEAGAECCCPSKICFRNGNSSWSKPQTRYLQAVVMCSAYVNSLSLV